MTDGHGTSSGQMSVDHSSVDGIRIVTLRGEIDQTIRDHLHQALLPPDLNAAPRIVVDLSGVSFMDSSGINILIATHIAATESQGWLRLVGPQGPVLRVMQLVGLDAVIPCYLELGQALGG